MNYEEAAREWNKYIRCQEKGKSKECYFEYDFDCDKCGNEMEISIDLVRTSIAALEKQIPKKPIATTKEKRSLGEYDDWQACPSCKMSFGYCTRKYDVTYCPKCGQAIDWSEVE